jgi:two-component sensor histidine kinase
MDYRDDGIGFPDDFKLEEQDSLGFKMINALIKQLDGQLTLSNENGARFVVTFEVEETKTKKLKTA